METAVDENEMEWETLDPGGRFAFKRERLGTAAHRVQLGCRYI